MRSNLAILSVVFLLVSIASVTLEAQQVLSLETYGKIKARRFTIGDEIEFQTSRFPDTWMKRTLYAIDADNQVVNIGDGWIPVSSITKIRIDNPSFWRKVGLALAYSAAVATFSGSAWAWVFAGVPPDWIAISIIIAPFTIGELINRATRYRTFKIGQRHRVKALDLSFYAPGP
jgi:hypothetical protein